MVFLMETLLLKVHLAFVLISIAVFLSRNVLVFVNPVLANHKLAPIITLGSMIMVPISAGMLASQSTISPLWLMGKMMGLVLYILFGVIAFKPSIHPALRVGLSLIALAAFVTTFIIAKQ